MLKQDQSDPEITSNIRRIKFRILLYIFVSSFIFLFSNEFLISVFNNRQDLLGTGFMPRLVLTFKPTVVAIFFVAWLIISMVILGILKPLFSWFRDGLNYEKARTATVKLPWVTFIVNLVFWFIGVAGYFIIKKGKAESGLTFSMTVYQKMCLGVMSAVFVALLVNTLTRRIKRKLNMISVNRGENDFFLRYKEYFVLFAVVNYTISNFLYLCFYYYKAESRTGMTGYFWWGVIGVGFFMMLAGALFTLIAKRDTIHQLRFLGERIDSFSLGEIDLTRRIVLNTFDEVGDLTVSFNRFLDKLTADFLKLKASVIEVKDGAREVLGSSGEVTRNTGDQARATEEIACSMEEFSRVMETVKTNVESQTGIVMNNAREAAELFNDLEKILDLTRSLLTANNGCMEAAGNGTRAIKSSVEKTQVMNRDVSEMAEQIRKAGQETESIDEILRTIEGIAEKTNLLSMNAAIEAAHAGDAGKGFAIVAEEIRHLSESSTEAVGLISERILKIKQSVAASITMARKGEAEAEENAHLSRLSGDALALIVEKMDETSGMIHVISEILGKLEAVTRQFESETARLRDLSVSIRDSVEQQTGKAQTIRFALSAMNGSQEKNADHSRELNRLSEKLDRSGNQLIEVTGQFKVGEA
jgi:methyl-accepting chemotaxis protein